MAFDPNDPKDVELLNTKIAEAVSREVDGLKKKNGELTEELRSLRRGKTIDPADFDKLQDQLDKVTKERDDAVKAATDAKKDADKARKDAEAATGKATGLATSVQLKEALTGANVAKQFMPAVEAMLKPLTSVKEVDGQLVAYVGDKTLSDHVKLWSQSDDGKHFIAAQMNGGGGATGDGNAKPGAKTMTRATFDALDAAGKMAASKDGVVLTD